MVLGVLGGGLVDVGGVEQGLFFFFVVVVVVVMVVVVLEENRRERERWGGERASEGGWVPF